MTKQTTLEILVAARALISDPESWTQYYFARDGYGREVLSRSNAAVCYCAQGAVIRSGGSIVDLEPLLNRAAMDLYSEHLSDVLEGQSLMVDINDGYFAIRCEHGELDFEQCAKCRGWV